MDAWRLKVGSIISAIEDCLGLIAQLPDIDTNAKLGMPMKLFKGGFPFNEGEIVS